MARRDSGVDDALGLEINKLSNCCCVQIDGSTLKTLCVQHGPLQNFHLYLNHGIALAKYSMKDEANKVSIQYLLY